MKYSREYIIKGAFDVFMTKGYDSTSISVLQTELKMSRGALYRYFKNKEELFIAVIDEYFFKVFDRLLYKVDPNITAEKLIGIVYRRQKLILYLFTKADVTHTIFLNYTALMIQAAKYYPLFITRFRAINNNLISYWKTALENSVSRKEIRVDIDIEIMSALFNNLSVKESSDTDFDESKFIINVMKDMERKKQVMDYMYSLIKI